MAGEMRSLGAVSCVSFPPTPKHPPGFYLNPFPTAAWSPPADEVVRACDEFLAATPDVPAKLLASGLTERHAVVMVTTDWLGPLIAIEDGALPAFAPTLPTGVDCLWMVTLRMPPIRAIYWLGDGVWHDIVLNQQLDPGDEMPGQVAAEFLRQWVVLELARHDRPLPELLATANSSSGRSTARPATSRNLQIEPSGSA